LKKYSLEKYKIYRNTNNNIYLLCEEYIHPKRNSGTITLIEHYRSHPLIIGFVNEHIYNKSLKLKTDKRIYEHNVFGIPGIKGYDIKGKLYGKSKKNSLEAEKVVSLIKEMLESSEWNPMYTIGVVTPFKDQERYIQEVDLVH
jgi:superfamily I DNA and/or RNA helicase